MAKMFRVMGNRLGYGTFVAEDRIPNEALALKSLRKFKAASKKKGADEAFFTQEYEESRNA